MILASKFLPVGLKTVKDKQVSFTELEVPYNCPNMELNIWTTDIIVVAILVEYIQLEESTLGVKYGFCDNTNYQIL